MGNPLQAMQVLPLQLHQKGTFVWDGPALELHPFLLQLSGYNLILRGSVKGPGDLEVPWFDSHSEDAAVGGEGKLGCTNSAWQAPAHTKGIGLLVAWQGIAQASACSSPSAEASTTSSLELMIGCVHDPVMVLQADPMAWEHVLDVWLVSLTLGAPTNVVGMEMVVLVVIAETIVGEKDAMRVKYMKGKQGGWQAWSLNPWCDYLCGMAEHYISGYLTLPLNMEHTSSKVSVRFIKSNTVTAYTSIQATFGSSNWMPPLRGKHDSLHRWTPPPGLQTVKDHVMDWSDTPGWTPPHQFNQPIQESSTGCGIIGHDVLVMGEADMDPPSTINLYVAGSYTWCNHHWWEWVDSTYMIYQGDAGTYIDWCRWACKWP
ncbi:hypothetical protein J3A83DRAFT_4186237 [Scleroderma citrinum]